MHTQTNTVEGEAHHVPTGEDIYNSFMGNVEQDLLTSNIPSLDAKYQGETKEQHTARMTRYKAAYEAYDKVFAEWVGSLHEATASSRRTALREAEEQDKAAEQKELGAMEQAFQ